MPAITITKSYQDGDILTEADLDNIRNDVIEFLNVTKIDSDNIQDSGIATAKIQDNAIVTSKILDANVTTAKIADLNVTTGKIAVGAITGDVIPDGDIATAKIADDAVTSDKLYDTVYALSSEINTTITSQATYVDMTNATVSVTTNGRPMRVVLVPSGTDADPSTVLTTAGVALGNCSMKLMRDATEVNTLTPFSVTLMPEYVDVPTAGTYTYKIQWKYPGGSTYTMYKWKLLVYEL